MLDIDELRETIGQIPGTRSRLLAVQESLPHLTGTKEMHRLIVHLLDNEFAPPCWVSIGEQVCAHAVILATIMARENLPEVDWKVGINDEEARKGLVHLSENGYMARVMNLSLFASTYIIMLRHAERHGFVLEASSPEVTELEDLL